MRILIALLLLTAPALAQTQTPPYTYTPPPQQPAPVTATSQTTNVAPVPFGGLYNVLSGSQPSPNGQQPLTPFNAQPTAP